MTPPVRPVVTFVLRLWHEPDTPVGDAGWRGLLRPLHTGSDTSDEVEIAFQGLENLMTALRPLLVDEKAP
jgi:hypothetical protein